MAILILPLIQEEHMLIKAKECRISTSKLPLGGLPRKNVVRITDRTRTVMASAVYLGHKAINQTSNLAVDLSIRFVLKKTKLSNTLLLFVRKDSDIFRKKYQCLCNIYV